MDDYGWWGAFPQSFLEIDLTINPAATVTIQSMVHFIRWSSMKHVVDVLMYIIVHQYISHYPLRASFDILQWTIHQTVHCKRSWARPRRTTAVDGPSRHNWVQLSSGQIWIWGTPMTMDFPKKKNLVLCFSFWRGLLYVGIHKWGSSKYIVYNGKSH